MATRTSIEWTEMTWNPVTGCTKISQGCKHCYAERMANRLKAMGAERYVRGFRLSIHEDLMDMPRRWRRPRLVFVNSMSDLFQDGVPDVVIDRVFSTMAACPQHTFQVLTKRSERLMALSGRLPWPENVWMGVSVESRDHLDRIDHLARVPASVRFLSCEPLLGPLENLPLDGIHWVIVGGESGPKARPMQGEWVESVRKQCAEDNVAFFFKQWGGVRKSRTGRSLNGVTYDQMPVRAVPDHRRSEARPEMG
ncbi:MAG: DUF5131 family protein [Gammaproteobacteria bacterium]